MEEIVVEEVTEEETTVKDLKEREEKAKAIKASIDKEVNRYHSRNQYYGFLKSGCQAKRSVLNNTGSSFVEPIPPSVSGSTSGKKRNKKCQCGSGMKYKNCCLVKHNSLSVERADARKSRESSDE